MIKVYSRIKWINYPETDTPLNDQNLNKMDIALDAVDTRVVELDTNKADQTDLLNSIESIDYDEQTGVFVFKWHNGVTKTVDLNIEKIPVSFSMSPEGVITMITADGTEYKADVSKLIKTYSFENTSDITWEVNTDVDGNKVISATIVDGSITEAKLRPNYLADIRVESAKAENSALEAKGSELRSSVSETNAHNSEVKAKALVDNAMNILAAIEFRMGDDGHLYYMTENRNITFRIDPITGQLQFQILKEE